MNLVMVATPVVANRHVLERFRRRSSKPTKIAMTARTDEDRKLMYRATFTVPYERDQPGRSCETTTHTHTHHTHTTHTNTHTHKHMHTHTTNTCTHTQQTHAHTQQTHAHTHNKHMHTHTTNTHTHTHNTYLYVVSPWAKCTPLAPKALYVLVSTT